MSSQWSARDVLISAFLFNASSHVCAHTHPEPDTIKQARRGKALQALESFFSAGLDDPETTVRARQVL